LAEAPDAQTPTRGTFSGRVIGFDRTAKTITIEAGNPSNRISLFFRDDTTFKPLAGERIRLDDFLFSNSNRLPFGLGDQLEVTWETSSVTKKASATGLVRLK